MPSFFFLLAAREAEKRVAAIKVEMVKLADLLAATSTFSARCRAKRISVAPIVRLAECVEERWTRGGKIVEVAVVQLRQCALKMICGEQELMRVHAGTIASASEAHFVRPLWGMKQ